MDGKAPGIQLGYEMKITLLDTKPLVWRRFAVPGEITLDRLHDIIQIIMGWQDKHLHLFKINDNTYTEKPQEDWEGQEENHYRLSDVVTKGAKFEYDYDMGDSWQHRIVVERVVKVPVGYKACVKCLGGKRRCPPEDVGGTYGFDEFLTACKNPRHPDHEQMLQWAGGSFDPNDFDADTVNLEIFKYMRWSRPRANGDAFGG